VLAERFEKSGAWERIADGEYLVENCTWNTAAATGPWSETIFADPATGERGWRWDFSAETAPDTRRLIKSFPEIIWGRKPYEGYASTTERLPVLMNAAPPFVLEYDIAATSEDAVYDTTTDIAFTSCSSPGPSHIRAKLMIWLCSANTPFFPDKPHTTAVIDGRECELFIDRNYEEPGQKRVYIAILPKDLPQKGEIHLSAYFEHLLSTGALKPGWFLSSIEAGTEIASGKGEITFRKFVVR
jgi:hypothetical protein